MAHVLFSRHLPHFQGLVGVLNVPVDQTDEDEARRARD